MCGRFTLTAPYSTILSHFDIGDQGPQPVFKPRYNIAPSQDIAVVMKLPDKPSRQLAMMHWGLTPHWVRDRKGDKKIGYKMINAKSETLAEKPSYRTPYKKRRCLIPADGYYEWKQLKDRKQPYYIQFHHHDLFAFAGLWEHWEGDQEEIYSCTIITTDANETVKSIHNRMPAVIEPEYYDVWLDPNHQDTSDLQELLLPHDGDFKAYQVSTVVNSPKNDGRDLIERITVG